MGINKSIRYECRACNNIFTASNIIIKSGLYGSFAFCVGCLNKEGHQEEGIRFAIDKAKAEERKRIIEIIERSDICLYDGTKIGVSNWDKIKKELGGENGRR